MGVAVACDDAAMDWRRYEDPGLSTILLGALRAFVEHGYHGTTVRDIAQRAGVTVPALYYHFQNKQALLSRLLDSSMREVLRRTRAAVQDAGPDPAARLSAVVECIVLYMAHRRELAFLDSEIRSLEPDERAVYVALRDELEDLLTATVEAGVRAGQFTTPHPREASRAILTMCQGVATWYHMEGPLTPDEVAARYATFCLAVAGAPPAAEPSGATPAKR
jgi:AcrR family transcriptional regulator